MGSYGQDFKTLQFGPVNAKIIDLRAGVWPLGAEKPPFDFKEAFDPILYVNPAGGSVIR